MKRAILQLNFSEFVNTFSVWVLLGAISCFIYFSKLFTDTVNYPVAIILGFGCWWVYTLDHLWDGVQVKQNNTSLRHFIHRVYAKQLTYILIILFTALLFAVLVVVSSRVMRVGVLVFGLTAIHFFINHLFAHTFKKGLFFKEGMIAIVVTIGFCLLPGFERDSINFNTEWILDATSFFTLSLANLLLFTVFDFELDMQNGFMSSAQVYGTKFVYRLAVGLLLVSVAINAYNLIFLNHRLIAFFVILSMQSVLILILFWPKYFRKNERFRFWGDFIYVIPSLALPFL